VWSGGGVGVAGEEETTLVPSYRTVRDDIPGECTKHGGYDGD
jgi:hypothetical protein